MEQIRVIRAFIRVIRQSVRGRGGSNLLLLFFMNRSEIETARG
jgi:hypothetical protein